jgi:hypothetical protein
LKVFGSVTPDISDAELSVRIERGDTTTRREGYAKVRRRRRFCVEPGGTDGQQAEDRERSKSEEGAAALKVKDTKDERIVGVEERHTSVMRERVENDRMIKFEENRSTGHKQRPDEENQPRNSENKWSTLTLTAGLIAGTPAHHNSHHHSRKISCLIPSRTRLNSVSFLAITWPRTDPSKYVICVCHSSPRIALVPRSIAFVPACYQLFQLTGEFEPSDCVAAGMAGDK